MYTDKLLRLSTDQAVAGAASTSDNSTDHINFNTRLSGRDIGMGETLYALFTVTTAVAGGTGIEFQVNVGTTDDLGVWTFVATIAKRDFATATLAKGFQTAIPIPSHLLTSSAAHALRVAYYRNGTISAGNLTCDIVLDVQSSKSYASGFTMA